MVLLVKGLHNTSLLEQAETDLNAWSGAARCCIMKEDIYNKERVIAEDGWRAVGGLIWVRPWEWLPECVVLGAT